MSLPGFPNRSLGAPDRRPRQARRGRGPLVRLYLSEADLRTLDKIASQLGTVTGVTNNRSAAVAVALAAYRDLFQEGTGAPGATDPAA